jgi:hypothetical protein
MVPPTNTLTQILTGPLTGFVPAGTTLLVACHCDAQLATGGTLPQMALLVDPANGPNPLLSGAVTAKSAFSGVPASGAASPLDVSADFVCLVTGLTPGSPVSMTLAANVQGNTLTTFNYSPNEGMVVLNGLA